MIMITVLYFVSVDGLPLSSTEYLGGPGLDWTDAEPLPEGEEENYFLSYLTDTRTVVKKKR